MESQHTSVTRFFREQRALLASLLLFGLFLVELALLHRFKLYDLMVYDWMQQYRSCALDRAASFLKYWTTKLYLTVALVLFVPAGSRTGVVGANLAVSASSRSAAPC